MLTSGYTEHEVSERLGGEPAVGFLQKPFRPAELLERVRKALESSRT